MGADQNLPWFRMYAEFATDPVVQMLAFDDQRHFIMLLCFKCNGLLDREFSSHEQRMEVIRRGLGLDGTAWTEMRTRLISLGLVDEDLQPLNWDKRQYKSDSSRERVRAYRERKKQNLSTEKQGCNVTVTAQDTESDTDTEQIDRSDEAAVDKNAANAANGDKLSYRPWEKGDNLSSEAKSKPPDFTDISKRLVDVGANPNWMIRYRDRIAISAWVEAGMTWDDLDQAIERAIAAKVGQRFGALYLDPIVRQVIESRKNPHANGEKQKSVRAMSESELQALGAKLGRPPNPGETWPQYRSRLDEVLQRQAVH